MKYFQSIKNIALASAVLFGMQACEKLDRTDPIGDGGQTVVKLVSGGMAGQITPGGAGHILTGVDFVSNQQSLDILDVRRDVPNATELNRAMNVVLQVDTFALRIYNDSLIADGEAPLQVMPEAWYTLNYTPSASGIVNLSFAPGELAKQITITINDATLMDPTATYGFAFSILSVDANGKISTARTMIYEIGAKNAYDGVYSVVSGNVQRYTAGVPEPITVGGLNGSLAGNPDVLLITAGATSVEIPIPGPGGLQWANGANSGVAGVDGIVLTIDPATNLVTAMSSQNATFTNWAGHTNSYDPATQTFTLAWRWNPTGNTREYEIVLKYKEAR